MVTTSKEENELRASRKSKVHKADIHGGLTGVETFFVLIINGVFVSVYLFLHLLA